MDGTGPPPCPATCGGGSSISGPRPSTAGQVNAGPAQAPARAGCRVAQPARDTARVDNVVRPRDADGQLAGGGADGSTGGGSYRAYSPVVCWWRWGVGCSSRSWLHKLVGAGRLSVTRVAVGRAVLLTVGGAVGRIAGARAMVAVTGVPVSVGRCAETVSLGCVDVGTQTLFRGRLYGLLTRTAMPPQESE